jgi:hypothetical protein
MDYREEQLINQQCVQAYFSQKGEEERMRIKGWCREYVQFREDVAAFQSRYFHALCNAACYQGDRSACCNKDGIITFFTDLVVNAVESNSQELSTLVASLHRPRHDMKCIYLGPEGCLWHVKPIVCEMFLCDRAQQKVFGDSPEVAGIWDEMKKREMTFRWPDRPVLFDRIESRFMAAGVSSSLMYLHNSPGLIRIKRNAGLL